MGMNLECMLYLQREGHLSREKSRLLDIGPQNIYYASEDQIRAFVAHQGATVPEDHLAKEASRIAHFSTPRPEERTSLLSEVTDLTNIEYNSFDVCPALKTEILDLNFDRLPGQHRDYFDVVLNFGTTEHVFNQWNSFKIIHEATKVGGVVYHQLPCTGYLDHGYFCYTPVFFKDLAKANGYRILDLFYTPAGLNDVQQLGMDVRDEKRPSVPNSLSSVDGRVPCFNVNAVLRKTTASPFRCALELATSHSAVDDRIAEKYDAEIAAVSASESNVDTGEKERMLAQIRELTRQRDDIALRNAKAEAERDELLASKSWRLTQPLRRLAQMMRAA